MAPDSLGVSVIIGSPLSFEGDFTGLGGLLGGILRSLEGAGGMRGPLPASDLTGPCSEDDFFTAENADEELVEVGEFKDNVDDVGGDGNG